MTATPSHFTISIPRNLARHLLVLGAVVMLVPQVEAQQPESVSALSPEGEIQQFCTNIADAARERRYLLQKQELESLQADVDVPIAILETRRAANDELLTRRMNFLVRAQVGLVQNFGIRKDRTHDCLDQTGNGR